MKFKRNFCIPLRSGCDLLTLGLQMALSCFLPPGASKMAPEWLPDDSQMTPQMTPRCLSASSPQLTSAQPAQLSQLSSAISAQPAQLSHLISAISAQLKIGLQSGTGAGLTQNRLSGRSLKGFVVVFWGALKTWIWGVSAISAQPSQLSQLSSVISANPS